MAEHNEVWRPVKGMEGFYEVSDLGRVRGIPRMGCDGRIRKPYLSQKGYHVVSLCQGSRHLMRKVHRLVAEAFIPNESNLPEINHLDECRTNNRADNLEWCTHKDNLNYGSHNARNGKSRGVKIAQFSKDGDLIATYDSAYEATRATGILASHIRECVKGGCYTTRNGKRVFKNIHTAGGFVWKAV